MDPQYSIVVVGSLNVDLITYVDAFPKPGETLTGLSFQQGCGGKGANQACAAALLCADARWVYMVGAVGDDPLGKDYLRADGAFARSGVDVSRVAVVPGVSTGVAPIWVDGNGENCIVVVPGANATLTAGGVGAALDGLLEESCAILVQGEVPMAATAAALQRASSAGRLTFFTPAPVPPGGVPDALLALTSVIIPNRGELIALAGGAAAAAAAAAPGVGPAALDALRACAAALQARGAHSVVVTLGADGALVVGGEGGAAGGWAHVRAPRVAAVDTSGAGDAFSGALAFFVCAWGAAGTAGRKELPRAPFEVLVDAAHRAVCVAALSVTKKGTQQSYSARAALTPALFERRAWGAADVAAFEAWAASQ